MKYQLRDYQKKASDAAVMCFKMKSGRNGLLVLPTGAGKSLIIADIAARLEEPLIVFQPKKKYWNRTLRSCKHTEFGIAAYIPRQWAGKRSAASHSPLSAVSSGI